MLYGQRGILPVILPGGIAHEAAADHQNRKAAQDDAPQGGLEEGPAHAERNGWDGAFACLDNRRLVAQQGDQEGDRAQAVELDALLFQLADALLHLPAASGKLAFHRAGADLQGLRDLLDRDVFIVVHGDQHTLTVRELVQDLADQAGVLLLLQMEGRVGVGIL